MGKEGGVGGLDVRRRRWGAGNVLINFEACGGAGFSRGKMTGDIREMPEIAAGHAAAKHEGGGRGVAHASRACALVKAGKTWRKAARPLRASAAFHSDGK